MLSRTAVHLALFYTEQQNERLICIDRWFEGKDHPPQQDRVRNNGHRDPASPIGLLGRNTGNSQNTALARHSAS